MAGIIQGIGAEAFVVGGAKEGDDGLVQGGGEVHRAAVVADDEARAANQIRQLLQPGAPEQVDEPALGPGEIRLRAAATSPDNGRTGLFLEQTRGQIVKSRPFLLVHAAVGKDDNRPVLPDLGGQGQILGMQKLQRRGGQFRLKTQQRQKLQEYIQGVRMAAGGRQGRFAAGEQARALAAIGPAGLVRGPRRRQQQRAARQALHVQRPVVVFAADFPDETGKRGQRAMPLKFVNFVHHRAGVDKRGEGLGDDPVNLHLARLGAQRLGDLQGVDNIAKRRRLDYQDTEHFKSSGYPDDGRDRPQIQRFFVFYYLLAGMGCLIAALPESILVAGCQGLGWLVAALPGKRRHTLRANLHHAFPEKTEAWRRKIALEASRRSLEMVLFILGSPYFSKERLKRQFSVHEELQRLFRENEAAPKPTVVLSPHLSLMEANTLTGLLYDGKLPPMGAIYRPFDAPGIERWVKQTRERWGLKLLSRKEGYFQAVDMLRKGGAIVVLFDQNAGNQGALSLFMGRICSTTELPGILTEKCKARVAFIYPERRGFMRSCIRGEYLDVPCNSDAVLFASNRWLENKLRSSDDVCADWLWLHNRWRNQNSPERRFRLEAKRNLLPEQMASLGLTTLPRRTRYFIRLPNWLGDVVMALPLLRALRISRPDAEMTLIAQPGVLPLLERLGVGDRFLALPPKGPAQKKFYRGLREEYPDVYVLLTNSWRGDAGAKATGAPQRFGLVRPGKWRPFLTHSWRMPEDLDEANIHHTRVLEKFFQHFGLRQALDLQPLNWPGNGKKSAGLNIGLICGTENFPEKRWPVERWRELMQTILAVRGDAMFTLFGTANDVAIANAVAEGFSAKNIRNLCGKTSLVELADELKGCAVVVCNDTGGMHLANLIGVPVVVVYGPTNPVRTGPIFEAPHVIVQPPGCPPTGGAPLAQLPEEQVFEALKPWLEHR